MNDTDGDERERKEQQKERTNVVQTETGPTDKRSSWFESAALPLAPRTVRCVSLSPLDTTASGDFDPFRLFASVR